MQMRLEVVSPGVVRVRLDAAVNALRQKGVVPQKGDGGGLRAGLHCQDQHAPSLPSMVMRRPVGEVFSKRTTISSP